VSTKIGNTTVDRIWSAALDDLQRQMTQATFDAWLRDSKLVRYEDDTTIFVVSVKSDYARDWLENRLLPTIERTLVRLTGQPAATVEFVALNGDDSLE